MSIPNLEGSTELIICQHMVNDFAAYLKSDVMYWHVAEPHPLGSQMPQLTIGALLEALARAQAGGADPQALATVRTQHDRIRAAHQALYVGKATAELKIRLNAWRANLQDEATRKEQEYYAQDVRVRAKIYLLEQALGADVPPELQRYREKLDRQLRAMFALGAFVWDERLKNFFPREPCWWLYGHVVED